jgi:hypothetical protein
MTSITLLPTHLLVFRDHDSLRVQAASGHRLALPWLQSVCKLHWQALSQWVWTALTSAGFRGVYIKLEGSEA